MEKALVQVGTLKITVVAVELNGARIYGDGNSLVFDYDDTDDGDETKSFELTWPEIWKACQRYSDES